MSFISYAQNFEDVMLWRALKHIEKGFYIDVGANDPAIDSVTKVFYTRGWRGINLEPLSSHYNDLQAQRPEDINLCCAVGAKQGELELFECDIRGWGTANQAVAEKHQQEGHMGTKHLVPVRTLAEICREHVITDIHFLKVDVEGLEKEVLLGADWSIFRPWIVVVEATKPNSTEEVHEEWEPLLVNANYHLVYADGLNRFYVSNEHLELADKLKYPPNVFDDFIRVQQLESELRAQQAEVKAQQAEVKAQQAEAALHAVYNSRSWKLTAPLRWLTNMFRKKVDQ